MKKGDVLNGYVLTTDSQSGGGHSEWAFAAKGGEQYFFKRFLQPTFPLPDGLSIAIAAETGFNTATLGSTLAR